MHEPQTLYHSNPSMFRNSPVGFILACALVPLFGLGLVILFIWWLRCKATTLTVTDERTIYRRGILAKSTNEVWHADVRNVQIDQTFFQRIFDVGTIGISSAGQAGLEIDVPGIPSPGEIKKIIDNHRRASR